MNDAVTKNILAIKQHSEETRRLLRELDVKINTIETLTSRVNTLSEQVSLLQIKLYSGGATS